MIDSQILRDEIMSLSDLLSDAFAKAENGEFVLKNDGEKIVYVVPLEGTVWEITLKQVV